MDNKPYTDTYEQSSAIPECFKEVVRQNPCLWLCGSKQR